MSFLPYSCIVFDMNKREKIILRPSPVAYGDYYLLSVLIILVGVLFLRSLPVTILGIIAFLFTEFLRRGNRYIFDDTHLRIQFRFLSWSETSIPYHQIQSIRIEQDILDRPLRIGSLLIDTAGTHSERVILNTISFPEKVKEIIERRIKE